MFKGTEIIKAGAGMPVKDTASRLMGEMLSRPRIYGWHVDPSISDPAQAVTYLADAVGKAPAAMGATEFSYGDWSDAFFMPKPCMLRSDGTVAYYLDPDDYTKKADGTASDVANASFEGNAMMEWPLIWYKFEAGAAEGEGYFYCSDQQVDSSYKCWCNINANDEMIPHFYTAIYASTVHSSRFRSLSGQQLTQESGNGYHVGAQEMQLSQANNTTTAVEWNSALFCDRMLINALMILISKSLDNHATFGKGKQTSSYSSSPKGLYDIQNYITGTMNDKGLFYGSTTDPTVPVKIFGIENWYGLEYIRILGLIRTISGSAHSLKAKLTYGTQDGSTVTGYNGTGNGYIDLGLLPGSSSAGYVLLNKLKFSQYGFIAGGLASSETDYWITRWYNNNVSDARMGAASGQAAWLSEQRGRDALSYLLGAYYDVGMATDWTASTTLSCKPVNRR